MFLGDVCLGSQCQIQCKYKYDQSSADIRIGDLWGNTYKDDQKGVSALISFTDKGREVVETLTNVTLKEHPFETVAEGQMKENAHAKEMHSIVMWYLRKGFKLSHMTFKSILFLQRVITRINIIIGRK